MKGKQTTHAFIRGSITDNWIGGKAAPPLSSLLLENTTLKELNLGGQREERMI